MLDGGKDDRAGSKFDRCDRNRRRSGSFTGLRIGSATAKGLGLALNKPIINVPTVDALAYNLVGHAGLVCPLMDARRNQTYTGLYSFCGNEMVLKEQCAVGIMRSFRL